jgi:hypothetical protein
MSPAAEKVLQFLASCPAGTTTETRGVVREILLETGGNMMACGSLYDIDAKLLGAGVYKLSLKRTHGAAS